MRKALAQCTFVPGSAHKRFARDLPHAKELTEAQVRHLIRLCWRYRRQMPADLVPSKDAVLELDADWNLRVEAAAAEKTAAKRTARAIRKRGPVPVAPQLPGLL
jgi:hypothetical protein